MSERMTFTIFGGTGDLTFRKLLPALYNRWVSPQEERLEVVIIGRREYTSSQYRKIARDWVKKFARLPYEEQSFEAFAAHLAYYRMDFTDQKSYEGLNAFYKERDDQSHLFYFAVAPRFFEAIVHGLVEVEGAQDSKVILEKPFGENLQAAGRLNEKLEAFFPPEHIYRIDHYLGKEMVRNIQTIRFTNPIFSNIWNAGHIESIQISALEDVGVETRGGYYDTSGAMKDMVQNHLFQILSIVAMERPEQFSGLQMHKEQLKVLHALRPVDKFSVRESLILGQYEGYREEPAVAPDSQTETYAALRLFVDNERWMGMPFYIRTGKKMGRREMVVTVVFRRSSAESAHNILHIRIQPTEGVQLQFNIKKPGDSDEIIQTKMDFCQSCSVTNRINTPEAYERLLGACIRGERSWFSQWDQVETSWKYVENLHGLYYQQELPVYSYPQGQPGPKEAVGFLDQFGHQWFD